MRILIVTHAKSGSTALTYFLKKTLSRHKVVFEPKDLALVDPTHPNVICKFFTRDPESDIEHASSFDKVLCLVRHPFDRLVSYLLYFPFQAHGFLDDRNVEAYVQLIEAKQKQGKAISTRQVLQKLCEISQAHPPNIVVGNTMQLIRFTEHAPFPYFTFKYEDLVDRKFKAMADYLGVKGIQVGEVDPKFQRVKRTASYGDWKNWFTLEDVAYFKKMKPVARYLEVFGYESSVEGLETHAEMDPATSSEYVIKVVNNFRKSHHLPLYERGVSRITEASEVIRKGVQYVKSNDPESALEQLDIALAIYPTFSGLHFWRSRAFKQLGQFEEELAAIERAIELDPGNELNLKLKFLLKKNINKGLSHVRKQARSK